MKRFLVLVLATAFLSGCVISGPANDVPFTEVAGLQSLAGEYRNLGETDPHGSPAYLSAVIWPVASDIDHASVDVITVDAVSDKELVVRALAGDRQVKEGHFVAGEGFTFKDGKLYLKQKTHFSLAYPAGNPFIGPGYEETVIGVDREGHGKLRHKTAFAGTAFLVIPVAGSLTDETRFLRLR